VRVRTVAVEPKDVSDAVTKAAHALWVAAWSVTAVNENNPQMVADAHVMSEYVKFGDWSERRNKAIQTLTDFYRTWYGDEGAALIDEYFKSKYFNPALDATNSMRDRFKAARRALTTLHGGLIVDAYNITRLTDEPVAEFYMGPYSFDV
jgi:hypothetical protein